jgi:tRNA pseudouridine55 synthase
MAAPSTQSGIALVDKPAEWTSHDVVAKSRRLFITRKVGHAGTLDPMATGLLVIGVNSSTRLLTYLVGLDKEYTATIRLGASSTTDDAEGEILGYAPEAQIDRVTEDEIAIGVASLTGEIDQVPSSVSAIKVDGQRAYARVRSGEVVELAARPITISEFEILAVRRVSADGNACIDVDVRVSCSSGTYIRALARDLGFTLGVGGHLTALRRTRVGPFRIEDAHAFDPAGQAPALLTPTAAATAVFPRLDISDAQATDLQHGKRPHVQAPDGGPQAAVDPTGRLVGLVEVTASVARTIVNFPSDSQGTADA